MSTYSGVLGRLSQQKHVERQVRGRRMTSPAARPYQHSAADRDCAVHVTADAAGGFCEFLRSHNIQQLEVTACRPYNTHTHTDTHTPV